MIQPATDDCQNCGHPYGYCGNQDETWSARTETKCQCGAVTYCQAEDCEQEAPHCATCKALLCAVCVVEDQDGETFCVFHAPAEEEDHGAEPDSLRTLGLCEADFR